MTKSAVPSHPNPDFVRDSINTQFTSRYKSWLKGKRLSAGVATVDDHIGTGGVCASVRQEIDVGALQLLGLTGAVDGDHRVPQVLSLLVDEVGQTGVDVAGRDAVDTGKSAPLVGQRLGHVDAAGLGYVVAGLLLREVDNVAGHGGGDDERTGAALLEVRADGLGTVL